MRYNADLAILVYICPPRYSKMPYNADLAILVTFVLRVIARCGCVYFECYVRFIKTVQENDMALILRVGPYICAEWNFGGLPPWLLGVPGIQVHFILY